MRSEHEIARAYTHAGFFVLRTPLLTFDEFLRLNGDLRSYDEHQADDAALNAAVMHDRIVVRRRLQELVGRPALREALYVASPDLLDALETWKEAPESDRGQRAERALLRYVFRATYRATPFGLFAGVSVAALGGEQRGTELRVASHHSYRRHTRVDLGHLSTLLESVARDPVLRRQCRYRVNSSLYRAAGRQHYVEWRTESNGARMHHLCAVESTRYLEATLERARTGASFRELVMALVDVETTDEEASEYVTELIDNQLLEPDVGLAVVGAEPLDTAIRRLRRYPSGRHVGNELCVVRNELAALDEAGLGNAPAAYECIADRLRALSPGAGSRNIFQVDMTKPIIGANLDESILRDLLGATELLRRISPQYDELGEFVKAFTERYERQWVPLAEVLDEEIGIGLPKFDGSLKEPQRKLELNQQRQSVLAELVARTNTEGAPELVLSDEDLARLAAEPSPLPDAFAVMASLLAESKQALDNGDYRLTWLGAYGPSGATLLGRFCHADPSLTAHVLRYLRMEEALLPDAIFCEVVHVPAGRIGNVLCRPRLRAHEIHYLGRSDADGCQEISITDLLVSVVDGRVVLRSERLCREVIPRLTSMHNFRFEALLPLYRFLGLLQAHRQATQLGWNWGLMAGLPHLPRVRAGRVILSRANWNVMASEVDALARSEGASRFRSVQEWRSRRGIPRLAVLVSGDNHLPIDFTSIAGVDVFVDLARRAGSANVLEMPSGSSDLIAENEEGRFTNEIVVPFIRTTKAPAPQQNGPLVRVPRARRIRAAGSDWLYVKWYTGPNLLDRLLRLVVRPMMAHAVEKGAIAKWYFVRFADPQTHLRLRFQGDATRLREEMMPLLVRSGAGLLDDGLVWRIQYDTYEREIERYGGEEGMLLAESLFHADSDACLELLTRGGLSASERQMTALRCIHVLFEDFGISLVDRLALLERHTASASAEVRKGWGAEYRRERSRVEAALSEADTQSSVMDPVHRIVGERSARVRPIATALKAYEADGRLLAPVSQLFFSYSHMHLNRLLATIDNRAVEPTISDFLRRYYVAMAARLQSRN